MIAFLLFLAYIIVGSIVMVLASRINGFFHIDLCDDPFVVVLLLAWPVTTLPLFILGCIKKLFDLIFKD